MAKVECTLLADIDATIEEARALIKLMEAYIESIRRSTNTRYVKGEASLPTEEYEMLIHKGRLLAQAKRYLSCMEAIRSAWARCVGRGTTHS